MCNPPAHLVLAVHGALTRCFQPFRKVASQGPTAGFPYKLPLSLGRQAPEAGKIRLLGTGSSAAFGWDTAEVELALEAGAEFLWKGPSDHGQLALSLLHSLAVVSHNFLPSLSTSRPFQSLTPPPAPHYYHL